MADNTAARAVDNALYVARQYLSNADERFTDLCDSRDVNRRGAAARAFEVYVRVAIANLEAAIAAAHEVR